MSDEGAKIAEALRLKVEPSDWGYQTIGKAVGLDRHKVRRAVEHAERKGAKVPAEKVVVDVALQGLRASPHARPINAAHVDVLAKSIVEIGHLIEPIAIRPLRPPPAGNQAGPVFEVMVGLHRVEAFAKLRRETIPAVIHDVDDLAAELMLIDENLCRHDLSPAERAIAVIRRKAIYLQLHPETAHGGDRGASRQVGDLNGDAAERFTKVTADTTGIGERTIQRDAARGEKLGEEVLQRVAGTSLDKGEELDALAKLSPQRRNDLIERAASGEVVTAKPAVKQEKRQEREAVLGAKIAGGSLDLPEQKFGVILADPAWGRTVYSEETGMDRHAANHYPTATGDETTQDDAIKALPVASIAADDCVLGLWCTDPHRGVDVLRAWGFEPKSYIVWVKDIVEIGSDRNARAMFLSGDRFEVVGAAGLGYIRRDRCELLLIGVRGKPVWPAPGTQGESVWFARRGEHATSRDEAHSDKPECSLQWFERHWPNTPKIELNARRARPGWARWGFDAPPADREDEAA
jgi:N6-adenosine-specific RNA methylase IME4